MLKDLKSAIKIIIIFIIIFIVIGYSAYFIVGLARKNSVLNIDGNTETLGWLIIKNDTLTKGAVFNPVSTEFIDIIYNSKLVGIGRISSLSELQKYTLLYEKAIDDSFFVQKLANFSNPVLFYYRIYTYEGELYILLTYSVESVRNKQTQDYHALYRYTDITPEDIIPLIPAAE